MCICVCMCIYVYICICIFSSFALSKNTMFSQWTKSIENFRILYNNGESFLPSPLPPMLTIYKLEPGEMYTILAKLGNIIVPSYLLFIHLYETPSLIFSLVYSKKSFLKPEPFSSKHFPGIKAWPCHTDFGWNLQSDKFWEIPCQFGALFCYLASQIYTTLLTCHPKADKFPISPDFMSVSF